MAFVMSYGAGRRAAVPPGSLAVPTLEGVSVEFVTTDVFVASVLPPGFEPADQPVGMFRIQQMQSGMCGDFNACTTVLRARFREWEGQYCLSMLISGEMPVVVGREFWGEVKKHGFSQLFDDGDRVHAFGSRNGQRLLELGLEVGADMDHRPPRPALWTSWRLSPTGGLQAPPRILVHRITSHLDFVREGTANVNVRSGPFDLWRDPHRWVRGRAPLPRRSHLTSRGEHPPRGNTVTASAVHLRPRTGRPHIFSGPDAIPSRRSRRRSYRSRFA